MTVLPPLVPISPTSMSVDTTLQQERTVDSRDCAPAQTILRSTRSSATMVLTSAPPSRHSSALATRAVRAEGDSHDNLVRTPVGHVVVAVLVGHCVYFRLGVYEGRDVSNGLPDRVFGWVLYFPEICRLARYQPGRRYLE